MKDYLILLLIAVVLFQQYANQQPQAVALQIEPTKTAMPTFTPTATATPPPTLTPVLVELVVAPTATDTPSPTATTIYSLDTPTPAPTPTSPVCVDKLPGAKSYGVAGCWTVSVFDTVGYEYSAAAMGEHRRNGDLTNSNIKCLAMNPNGDVFAIGNDTDIYQVANDSSFTTESVKVTGGGRCFWSPDGYFLAVQANDTIEFIPHYVLRYEKKHWPVALNSEEQTIVLISWLINGLLLVQVNSGDNATYWICHPIRGCVMEFEGIQRLAGDNQYHLPHSGGRDWFNPNTR